MFEQFGSLIIDVFTHIADTIGGWRRSKEFYTPDARIFAEPSQILLTEGDAMLGKLMLVVCELAEAAEEVRAGNTKNFGTEIVDAAIRLFDIAEAGGIEIGPILIAKMNVNAERPAKHGKRTNL